MLNTKNDQTSTMMCNYPSIIANPKYADLTPDGRNNDRIPLGGKFICYIYSKTVTYAFKNTPLCVICHIQSQIGRWYMVYDMCYVIVFTKLENELRSKDITYTIDYNASSFYYKQPIR
jgi:hypothetical protein